MPKANSMVRICVLALCVPLFQSATFGQNTDGDGKEKPATLQELEQKVKTLEELWEKKVGGEDKSRLESFITAGSEGFALKSGDGSFSLSLKGVLQEDGRYYLNHQLVPPINTFLIRRLRPIITGSVYKGCSFQFVPDFGGGTTVLFDAYLDIPVGPGAVLRAGKFKPPVGLEQLQADTNILFVERGLTSNLAPNRDLGFSVKACVFDPDILTFEAGVFNGVQDGGNGDTDTNDDKDAVGRAFAAPFKKTDLGLLNGLGLGFSATYGNKAGLAPPTYKSAGQQTIFSYAAGVTATGKSTRLVPQAFYYLHNWGLLAEYAYASQEYLRTVSKSGVGGVLINQAWQVAASWVVTGETNSYNGVKARDPLDWEKGTLGALEIVGRCGQLTLDNSAGAFTTFADPTKSVSRASEYGAGVNWYMNRDVKINVDVVQTLFDAGAGAASAVLGRETENTVLSRLQLAY